MLGVATPSAQATTQCNPNGTLYYGQACLYSTSDFYGLSDELEASVFSGSDLTGNNHIIDSVWAVNTNSSPVHFLEAGFFEGNLCIAEASAQSTTCNQAFDAYSRPRFYWVADRNDTQKNGYFGHIDQNNDADNLPTPGENYFGGISRPTTSTNWAVQAGPFTGTSGANPLTPNLIRTGIEVVEPGDSQICAEQTGLQYLDTSGNLYSGWTANAETGGNQPPYVEFTSNAHTAAQEWNGETYSSCFG